MPNGTDTVVLTPSEVQSAVGAGRMSFEEARAALFQWFFQSMPEGEAVNIANTMATDWLNQGFFQLPPAEPPPAVPPPAVPPPAAPPPAVPGVTPAAEPMAAAPSATGGGVTTLFPEETPEEREERLQRIIERSGTRGGRGELFSEFLARQDLGPTQAGAARRQFNPLSAQFALQRAGEDLASVIAGRGRLAEEPSFLEFLGGGATPAAPGHLDIRNMLNRLNVQREAALATPLSDPVAIASQAAGAIGDIGGATGENIIASLIAGGALPSFARFSSPIGERLIRQLRQATPIGGDIWRTFARQGFQFQPQG